MSRQIGESRRRVSHVTFSSLAILSIGLLAGSVTTTDLSDEYNENLFIKPLVDGKLLAHFKFRTLYRKDIKSLRWENRVEVFPLSIVDLVATIDLETLHFSLTKGNWNYRDWGYPIRSSPPGAQIRAQFSRHNENLDRSWKRLVNSLAGKFCSSFASADEKSLVTSRLLFSHSASLLNSTDNVFYSNLPEETLCTENLTPWKKLLPCYSKSGLASLLNSVNLLKSSYSSLSIDLEPKACVQGGENLIGCERVELVQTISVVFNPLLQFDGKQTWSLTKLFGNPIKRKCPLAEHSRIYVDISELDDKNKLYPPTHDEFRILSSEDPKDHRIYAVFDAVPALQTNSTITKDINLGIKQNQIFKRPPASSRPNVPIQLRTHIAGTGLTDGTIVATVTNDLDQSVRITYMDAIPHFLRVYMHTLSIRTSSGQELRPDSVNFILSVDERPSLIEFTVMLPANSEAQISYDFERAFLRWTDFKPDANKGVLLGSIIISVPLKAGKKSLVMHTNEVRKSGNASWETYEGSETLKIYARPLLVILPTPDFSMPYNVICLVCTLLAAAFGPLHSMTTKKPIVHKRVDSNTNPDATQTDEVRAEKKKDE